MIGRPRTFMIVLGAAAAAIAVVRHVRGTAIGRNEPGGMLMGDAVAYDVLSRLVLGPFFGRTSARSGRRSSPLASSHGERDALALARQAQPRPED